MIETLLGARAEYQQGRAWFATWAAISRLPRIVALLSLFFLPIIISGCPAPPPSATTLGLSLVAEGFTSPVGMAAPDDGSGRIFIVDQIGQIRIVTAEGFLLPEPFLDVSDRMVPLDALYDERGLLSMAFHPEFMENGRFFIFYNAPLQQGDPEAFDSRARISEFTVSENDPNRANPESESILLEVLKPQFNHNGGQVAFGPDGYLYVSVGDGGGANDVGVGHTPQLGNGQDTTNLRGAILRYNADIPGMVTVPTDNPFLDDLTALDPIYAYGLRNPWRFSFDRGGEHRLFCADAGQDLYEEVDIITPGGNYGWNIREGSHCFNPDNPATPPSDCPEIGADGVQLIDPVIEYSHFDELNRVVHTVVVGGYVYRGTAIPELAGHYLFGDWSSSFTRPDGAIFIATENESGAWEYREAAIEKKETVARLNRFVLGFGQDLAGEVYLLTTDNTGPRGTTGTVHKIISARVGARDIDVQNFRFEADGSPSTQVDTLTISPGDTVVWHWVTGSHTVTSGETSTAPDAGDLFDEPLSSANPVFSFTFTEAGSYPYFCRPHESLNMKGVIEVR